MRSWLRGLLLIVARGERAGLDILEHTFDNVGGRALDEAQALRTEAYPANRGLADAYQQAVVALRRAWIGCETHGTRVGTAYLDQAGQDELDTALKLYNHATASTTPAEQATYYGRVREIVSRLAERGVIHPPRVQLAQLEGVTRRAIESRAV